MQKYSICKKVKFGKNNNFVRWQEVRDYCPFITVMTWCALLSSFLLNAVLLAVILISS
jgi:hypothetical protein